MTEETKLTAYCMKCKVKQEIQDPEAVFTAKSQPATRGICSACGTKMFRMGRTSLHEGMEAPQS